MKEVSQDLSHTGDATELAPVTSPSVLSPEAWDRRGRDQRIDSALSCLEHAARHLIFDQMRSDRTYVPGAHDAVELLWNAMLAVEATQVTRERVERLSSILLPQHIVARVKGNGPPAH